MFLGDSAVEDDLAGHDAPTLRELYCLGICVDDADAGHNERREAHDVRPVGNLTMAGNRPKSVND
jgi:hypothetical protein